MSWITDDWRLKLLALGLAVLMLGAVAFSQNPPTSVTIKVGINYSVPQGLILINPPKQTTVTVQGLADLVSAANAGNTAANADVSKAASTGPSVKVNLVGTSVIHGLSVLANPIVLNIDTRGVVQLAVSARIPRGAATGWQITKQEAQCSGPPPPCTVTFDGPASWEDNLKAYADYPLPVAGSLNDFPSAPVVLEQNGTSLDYVNAYTVPQLGLNIKTVSIHIEANSSTTSRQVTLIDAPPSNPPPTCYRVTGIAIDPSAIVISGPSDAVPNITTITLPAADLSQHTSDFTFRIAIPALPAGVTGSATTARVTYSISRNPSCTPPSP
ncbi:MAG TPA: YbbR-like domain-containing protein [Candidatus Dormibacteraeota bacterium]